MQNSKGWAIRYKLILYSNLLLGAESSKEGCIGVWILGAPEGSSWPAGARVHVAARLGPPRCCVPALSCCTTTQTGQHRWLPVRSFWSQYCSHAHRLLQLSQNFFFFFFLNGLIIWACVDSSNMIFALFTYLQISHGFACSFRTRILSLFYTFLIIHNEKVRYLIKQNQEYQFKTSKCLSTNCKIKPNSQ